jgi:hypothetical protein
MPLLVNNSLAQSERLKFSNRLGIAGIEAAEEKPTP